MTSKRIYAAWAGVHFFLITVICLRGIFALVAADATILPSALNTCARSGEVVLASVLGKDLAASNPWRLGIATYLDAAGSQAGYGFFAPNIPAYHRLILELYHEDGHVEYLTLCEIGGCHDNIYLNDQDQPAAGLHENDSVVAGSSARPLITPVKLQK